MTSNMLCLASAFLQMIYNLVICNRIICSYMKIERQEAVVGGFHCSFIATSGFFCILPANTYVTYFLGRPGVPEVIRKALDSAIYRIHFCLSCAILYHHLRLIS